WSASLGRFRHQHGHVPLQTQKALGRHGHDAGQQAGEGGFGESKGIHDFVEHVHGVVLGVAEALEGDARGVPQDTASPVGEVAEGIPQYLPQVVPHEQGLELVH
ncbi:hypothetical protein RZS08_23245, partial [Arthrospira platensis SPKY1]|nr:hypothetical protein [Arthrospira platensis SPKY1]